MDGFERRKAKKMAQIFAASLDLFLKYGFQKVSVNEIAQKARVSPATIYNYFGTKEQLYAGLLTDWMDKQLEQYEEIVASNRTFPDKCKAIMVLESRNLRFLMQEFPKDAAVPSESTGFARTMEQYGNDKIAGLFRRLVALGKREGYIRPNQPDELAMLYYRMFADELARHWQSESEGSLALDIDQWMEMFFFGLAGNAQRTSL